MTWLAGVALVLDCFLVLLLAFLGVFTTQSAGFLWFTIGMTTVLVVSLAAFVSLLGSDGAEEAPGEAATAEPEPGEHAAGLNHAPYA
jgi:hypothetical protein